MRKIEKRWTNKQTDKHEDADSFLHNTTSHKKKKAKEISASWFSFTHYTSTLCRSIQNLKSLTLIRADESVMKNCIGEKEKWTIKATIRRLIYSKGTNKLPEQTVYTTG